MQLIKHELSTNRKIYREIFLKSKDEFFNLADQLKKNFRCNNCFECCRLTYAEKTPLEIDTLILNGEDEDNHWHQFKELFIPCGAANTDNWSDYTFNIEQNQHIAREILQDYADKVLKYNKHSTFYFCKYFDEKKRCTHPQREPEICSKYPAKLLTVLHENCPFNEWQLKVESYIKKELSQQIYSQVKKIEDYREKFSCNRTGTCCRLSSSEYSYEELKDRANDGDSFAKQFISVFIPYKSQAEARKVFPEYIDFVLNEFGDNEKIYFYHCPHIDDNNLCKIYDTGKRPQICSDFPSNPLAIMFTNCGYIQWKNETIIPALTSHAMIEICMFTLDKLEAMKNESG